MRCPCLCYLFVGLWEAGYVSQSPYVWHHGVVNIRFKHASEE